MILECALFLMRKDIQQYAMWRKFTVQFMKHYKFELLSHFKLSIDTLDVPRVVVKNHSLFLAVMAALYHTGMFIGQQKELAEALSAVFDLGLKKNTIVQSLSGRQTDHEHVWQFFDQYKQYDFLINK